SPAATREIRAASEAVASIVITHHSPVAAKSFQESETMLVRMLVTVLALVSAAAASPKTKPWTATGRVVDVQGRPVAGAALDVSITNQEYHSVTIGRGVSGADGGFAFRLTTNKY